MQCVVRTFPNGWTITTESLEKRLKDGWCVVMCTPMTDRNGTTQHIEYILEKRDEKEGLV
jgi:hypothetical protein